MTGKIIKLLSGVYTVETPEGTYQCRAKGSFRNKGISPVPGDDVEILALPDHTGRIEKILERRNYLIRPNVANVDVLCYVSSFSRPTPFQFTIDKMLVIAQNQSIQPFLVFNKNDLPDEGDVVHLEEMYCSLGYNTYCISASTGDGIERLRSDLAGKTVVFAGNTGVGKSSVLNRLYPELNLATGEISDKLGRGRHTTRHIELFAANGGLIGDTPGFGALELEGYTMDSSSLDAYFPEFKEFTDDCAYPDCAHINEKNCGVRSAVKSHMIDTTRYESYCLIYEYLRGEESPWNKKRGN